MYSNEYNNLTTPMGFQEGFNQIWGANDEYALIQKKLFPDDVQDVLAKIDQIEPDKFSLQEVLVLHGLFWNAWYTQHQLVLDAGNDLVKSHLEILNSWESNITSWNKNSASLHIIFLNNWNGFSQRLVDFKIPALKAASDKDINTKTSNRNLFSRIVSMIYQNKILGTVIGLSLFILFFSFKH